MNSGQWFQRKRSNYSIKNRGSTLILNKFGRGPYLCIGLRDSQKILLNKYRLLKE